VEVSGGDDGHSSAAAPLRGEAHPVRAGGTGRRECEVGAGQRAARDAAVVSERTRGIGAGRRTCLGGGETQ
jgi:hypothetical protein